MFSDFIKHYKIIRTILRDVFLYGCFSREGLEGKRNVSSRKISYEIRRIQQYVEDEFIRIDRDGRYKLLSLTYDSILNTDNFLVNTYMTKSFTRTDLILYFDLLMILHSCDKPYSFREIEDILIGEGLISYDDISSKTIKRKLEEMCNVLGILDCKREKRIKYYSVASDILKELDDNEVVKLLTAVSLFKNIIFPVTAGYYCENTLKNYITYERGIKYDFEDYFQYRNLHFHPVIEEEILWQLLKAIHKRKWISRDYITPFYKIKDVSEKLLRPYKIRYDIQCGRLYLVGFDKYDKCIVSRLDKIESIKVIKDTYETGNLEELYQINMKYSWSSVHINKGNKPEEIMLEIIIDEPKENYIIEKIKSEVRDAAIERKEEGRYILTMLVNNSGEMVPWIRSYSGYIRIIKGRWLAQKLKESWKEMLEVYGDIS